MDSSDERTRTQMNSDTYFELLFFLSAKSLSSFARCCKHFSELVRYFHKHQMSKATICRWKYNYENICKNFKPCDPSPNIFEFRVTHDISEETGHLGVFVCFKKLKNSQGQETCYRFYLYTSYSQTFWEIDLNLKDDLFIYRLHFFGKHNILVYHYFDNDGHGSIVFDLGNLASGNSENFCTIMRNGKQSGFILSPNTRLRHCNGCHKNFPHIDINDLPFYNHGFSLLPDGNRLFLNGPKANGYDLCSELDNNVTLIPIDISLTGWIFGDRYYLSIDFNIMQIKVLDVLTQQEDICVLDENAEKLLTPSISTIFQHQDKFYFSNRKLQNWFILQKNHQGQWSISVLIEKDAISKPTFCPLEQSFVW